MIPHRWLDPEFEDEEDASREVEPGTVTGEEVAVEVEGKREVVNNLREEEDIVGYIEMEELQPLKANQ